jgi:hypothetical protein
MRTAIIMALAVLLAGCSSKVEPTPSSASLVMHDAKGELVSHRLPDSVTALIKGIVTAEPDEDVPEALSLEAVCSVDYDGHRYALEKNELIELLGVRTIRWKSEGIQAKILGAARVE